MAPDEMPALEAAAAGEAVGELVAELVGIDDAVVGLEVGGADEDDAADWLGWVLFPGPLGPRSL